MSNIQSEIDTIINFICGIDPEKWTEVIEPGKYKRYEVSIDGNTVELWACGTDGGRPFVYFMGEPYYDERVNKFYAAVSNYRYQMKVLEKEKRIHEAFLAVNNALVY